jgi:hypothetical protein
VTALILNQNHLKGSLPMEIGSLANLQVLDLSGNLLSGHILAAWSDLNNLSKLWLNDNPGVICWEMQEALTWALSLYDYKGHSQVCRFSFLLPIFGNKGD